MSTRSFIAKELENGKYESIYCHWDGYPEWNGILLDENYNTEDKVDELLSLGDLSSLREKAKPGDGSQHTFEHPQDDVTIAYHRDRGEPWTATGPKERTLEELLSGDSWQEYVYIFTKDREWVFYDLHEDEKVPIKLHDYLEEGR